tara:strand:- start:5414 stop:5662 length:249 start_codon:yes stop_codon:yes gene_type:complete
MNELINEIKVKYESMVEDRDYLSETNKKLKVELEETNTWMEEVKEFESLYNDSEEVIEELMVIMNLNGVKIPKHLRRCNLKK